jgi:hypothetical protein
MAIGQIARVNNEFTDALDVPEAYLALGQTPKDRQRAYRSLMDADLRRHQLFIQYLSIVLQAVYVGASGMQDARQLYQNGIYQNGSG